MTTIETTTAQTQAPTQSRARERSRGRWLARGLCTLTFVLIASGLILWAMHPNSDINNRFGFRGYDALLASVYALVGLAIASRQPRNLVGWLFFFVGLDNAIQFLATEYAIYALVAFPGSLPAGELAGWLLILLWPIAIVTGFIILPLVFPQGRLPSPRWRWLVGVSLAVAAGISLGYAIQPGPLNNFGPIENPYGIKAASEFAPALIGACYVTGIVVLLIVAYSLIQRLRHADGIERQQLKWFVYAIGISALLSPLGPSTSKLGQVLFILAGLLIPISVGIAILRYRLFDIDLIINRTLVYLPLTALLAGIFAATISISQRVFVSVTGQTSDAAVAFTTLVVVAVFDPLKVRLQAFVDKRFKEAPDPIKQLQAFREQVHSVIQIMDSKQITRRLLDEAVRAFGAESGAVFLQQAGKADLAQTLGDWKNQPALDIPLQKNGTQFGTLSLGARRDGMAYSPQEREMLKQTADTVADALALEDNNR